MKALRPGAQAAKPKDVIYIGTDDGNYMRITPRDTVYLIQLGRDVTQKEFDDADDDCEIEVLLEKKGLVLVDFFDELSTVKVGPDTSIH